MGMEVKITYVGKQDGEHPYWIEDWKHSAAECELELVQEKVPAFKVGNRVKLVRISDKGFPNDSYLNLVFTVSDVYSTGRIAGIKEWGGRDFNYEKGGSWDCGWELVEEPKTIEIKLGRSASLQSIQNMRNALQEKPKQTIMTKLTNAVKKFLSPDLQAQIKAGFRSEGTLELTGDGKTAAIEALLDATPAAMTAFTIAALEVVAEQEKTK